MRSSRRGRPDSLRKSPRGGAETFCHVPTSCAIDTKQRVVFTRFEGRITTTDIERHGPNSRKDPDFGLGFFELAHLTSVTEPAIDAQLAFNALPGPFAARREERLRGENMANSCSTSTGTHSCRPLHAFGIENSFYVDAEGLYRPACLCQSGHRIDDQTQLGCRDFTHPGGEFQIVSGCFRSGPV